MHEAASEQHDGSNVRWMNEGGSGTLCEQSESRHGRRLRHAVTEHRSQFDLDVLNELSRTPDELTEGGLAMIQ